MFLKNILTRLFRFLSPPRVLTAAEETELLTLKDELLNKVREKQPDIWVDGEGGSEKEKEEETEKGEVVDDDEDQAR